MNKRSRDVESLLFPKHTLVPCPSLITASKSIQPAFTNQTLLSTTRLHPLSSTSSLLLINHALTPQERTLYLAQAVRVDRFTGPSAFNSQKPRAEICYSESGETYVYAGKVHPTTQYPAHVLGIVPKLQSLIKAYFPDSQYTHLSNGIDILYGPSDVRGGSNGAHSDDEQHWYPYTFSLLKKGAEC